MATKKAASFKKKATKPSKKLSKARIRIPTGPVPPYGDPIRGAIARGDVLELMPLLAELYQEGADRGFLLLPGNNIGYFGPYESLWRGSGDDRVYWTSCNAGQNTLGIEADGTIKGCPSLPTSPYAGGNIRDRSLGNIWWNTDQLSLNRDRTSEELWGFCGGCYYAPVCKAGCTWTTHTLFGRAGNNPYCHHRALELSKQGLRERISQVARAPGVPFDHGQFELIVESADGTIDKLPVTGTNLVQIGSTRPKPKKAQNQNELIICRKCDRHVFAGTRICPFCDGDINALAKLHDKRMREARKAYKRLLQLLPQVEKFSRKGAKAPS
jgi:radical SAM protein with 4Fe4S-binding SPASM domain